MSFGHALYYPHINLTNKNWIKNALLFWDKLSQIVPQSVDPEDGEEIIKIKSESGFINDYHPERWDTSHAFQEFSRERPILESDSSFNDRYFRIHSRVVCWELLCCLASDIPIKVDVDLLPIEKQPKSETIDFNIAWQAGLLRFIGRGHTLLNAGFFPTSLSESLTHE